ncbi:sensor histidine kinase [Massilia sp. PWRC2]|uniref:sensor histidine kinase n=1 Tax=Massilia sp. PWRC2 TaxID=2804626 RepID=UPI003CF87141
MKNNSQLTAGESATRTSSSNARFDRISVSVLGDDGYLKSRRRTASRRRQDVARQGFLSCERRQLAQQIHDDLGAVLTAIKACICVAIARQTQLGLVASDLLEDAAVLADCAFATIRKIGVDLRPVLLEKMGVWAALEWQAKSLARRSGLAVTFYTDASLEGPILLDEFERLVYRVLSEAMINAEKHSGGSCLTLRIYQCNGTVVSVAQDNGVGAPVEELDGLNSLGLVSMREQATALGASLTVSIPAGQGICLSLEFPYEYAYAR